MDTETIELESPEKTVKSNFSIKDFLPWVGGAVAIITAVFFVSSEFATISSKLDSLDKTLKDKTAELKVISDLNNLNLSKLQRNLDRITVKLNDQVIPALNSVINKAQIPIKEVELIGGLEKTLPVIDLRFQSEVALELKSPGLGWQVPLYEIEKSMIDRQDAYEKRIRLIHFVYFCALSFFVIFSVPMYFQCRKTVKRVETFYNK